MGTTTPEDAKTMRAHVIAPWRSGHDCPDFLRISANGGMNKLPPSACKKGRRKKTTAQEDGQ